MKNNLKFAEKQLTLYRNQQDTYNKSKISF